ncbi:ArsR/SmtB family transcription factor [Streptomyces sp. NPDC058001]|uniref:ArsR/SmtB family transcription factor n=1 Tax=Streptomyces sp. NPDC058001 TaxID=3346300 RepID=UPI0036E7E523
MIRLRFTAADLRQITLAPAPNALGETALSVRHLLGRQRPGPTRPGLDSWRRTMRTGLAERAGILHELVSAGGYVPDFLLQTSADDFGSAVDLAALTPDAGLAGELAELHTTVTTGPRVRDLLAGGTDARRDLARDLHRYHRTAMAPLWPRIRATGAADRALRAETLLRGGVDALLATLGPRWQWQPPDLLIPAPRSYKVELCGRGLLLVPSYFARSALLMYRPTASTVLVYPMPDAAGPGPSADVLTPLLGRTRARVLAGLRHPAGTTALAERVGISLSTASEHTAVLRDAGLVSTTRIGSAVLHALTPLGTALLGNQK